MLVSLAVAFPMPRVKSAEHGAPGTALTMSGSSIDVRISRLRAGGRPAGRVRQLVNCAVAGAITLALPTVAASGAVLTVVAFACPA
ncbi:hypothetical protein SAMN04488564_112254 [Lentzea waywayandensis]|uniref:Uncharacterized protein n=1 Tax=Lentzea waywayandensis TaxID=84724 RepID=A0A1I6FE53_9PSEU|nr:hypothetical protein [Lentzea waywayandensis]SFR28143.1 hypothetical protein SAMN04488564_112254 [Lentzea waywayandensis]